MPPAAKGQGPLEPVFGFICAGRCRSLFGRFAGRINARQHGQIPLPADTRLSGSDRPLADIDRPYHARKMQCLLTIALLCLTNADSVKVSPFGIAGRVAEVRVGGGSAKVVLSSDDLGDFDPRRMNHACSDQICISYHKSCEQNAHEYACTYTTANLPYARWLRVAAPTKTAFRSVEMQLGILNERGDGKPVPLNNLDAVSDQPVPFCRHGGRGPQCPVANGS